MKQLLRHVHCIVCSSVQEMPGKKKIKNALVEYTDTALPLHSRVGNRVEGNDHTEAEKLRGGAKTKSDGQAR